ncbi:HAD family hydrolase [Paenibacillus sp. FSL H8-0034]|uniref:HAD family hydrolase n=1 Tax=Paenibacillus sp. FSL H8-0034 TaxID=2954671 RepID=UPI0030F6601F
MIKLIISDLDGTLLHNSRHIKPEDQAALHNALASGITVSFASGRMHPEIVHVSNRLGLSAHAVSQNGAFVHTKDHEIILQDIFETSLVRQLAQAAEGTSIYTLLNGPDYYVTTVMNEGYAAIEANLLAPLRVMPHAVEALGSELMCCKVSYQGEMEHLLAFKQELLSTHGDKIDAYISDVRCMDVMPRHVSKGAGIQTLLSYSGIRADETICIGDSFNDISMFGTIPNSFAMSTSHPEVQANAAYVVDSVAEAIAWALQTNAGNIDTKAKHT